MSTSTDKYYITEAGVGLDRFKWTSDTVATCRCPYCGDSKKKKFKTRGYFFVNPKSNSYMFKCHNCGIAKSLYNFFEDHFPDIFKKMKFDFVQNKKIEDSILKPMKPKMNPPKPKTVSYEPNIFEGYQTIFQLSMDHPAKQYAKERKLPPSALMRMYYVEDFHNLVHNLDPDKNLREGIPRLVMPMYDKDRKLFGVQGRAIGDTDELRYISIRRKDSDHPKIYGMERFDPNIAGYVVEGPIDSEFLPNCIALAGAGRLKRNSLPFDVSRVTMVFDNEPRNRDICKYMNGCLQNGFRVCIWGKDFSFKDINDAIMGGWSREQIVDHIEKNSEKGIIGIHKLGSWRV